MKAAATAETETVMPEQTQRKEWMLPAEGLPGGEDNTVQISVTYDKGGLNYFTYKQEPRGYQLTVSPCKVGEGFVRHSLNLGGGGIGRRFFVAPATRFNGRRFETLINAIAPHLDTLAAALVVQDYERIREVVTQARGVAFPEAQAAA